MKSLGFKIVVLTAMLLGLPLLGVLAANESVWQYLEFPPTTRFVQHEPFSWTAFAIFAGLELVVIVPLLARLLYAYRRYRGRKGLMTVQRFPWWGWAACVGVGIFWIVAWTRFPLMEWFQPHTFFPLWLSYVILVNALCFWRTGRCMLTNRTTYFVILFPVSALFWWYFEYLNRFVQNWYYLGGEYGPLRYFVLATLPFSTVLPAVLGTRDLLLSFPWLRKGFDGLFYLRVGRSRTAAWFCLLLSGLALTAMGIRPNYLFPLVWVAPLLIIVSLQTLVGERHVLTALLDGRWYPAVSAVFAAVLCGILWEMWNYYSLAKWEYTIPFVHRFQVFEMPVLGYAGYLPFGLECAAIGGLIADALGERSKEA
jgi:hypothetical protein